MSFHVRSIPAVIISAEMEAFLENAINPRKDQHPKNSQSDEDGSLAPTNAAEFEEEEEGAIDETDEVAPKWSSSWFRSIWIISLYIPFLIQCLFGASFYIIRTLVLGYLLQYPLQFFTVAEHWTVQWLGIENHVKHNSTPLPVLLGLGLLTLIALIVHPDGYTWVILRKIRYVPKPVSIRFMAAVFRCDRELALFHCRRRFGMPYHTSIRILSTIFSLSYWRVVISASCHHISILPCHIFHQGRSSSGSVLIFNLLGSRGS